MSVPQSSKIRALRASAPAVSSAGMPTWLYVAATASLFFTLAYAGLLLTRQEGRIAALWLPNAVVVVLLVRRGRAIAVPTLIAGFAANIGANLLVGDPLGRALGLAGANMIEIAIAACLALRFCGPRIDFERFGRFARFLALTGIAAPAASASVAAWLLAPPGAFFPMGVWLHWFVADSLGMMLVATSLLVLLDHQISVRQLSPAQIAEWAALFIGGTALVTSVFAQDRYPLLFLAAPVVLVHALRQGTAGAALSTIKIAVIASVATLLGHGPIALLLHDTWDKVIILQLFLATVLLMGIPVAVLLAEKNRSMADLAEREFQLAMLTDHSSDAVLAFDRAGRCNFASGAAERLYACKRTDLIGRRFEHLVDPRDSALLHDLAGRLGEQQGPQTAVFRRPRKPFEEIETFIEARCRNMPRSAGAAKVAVVASLRDVTDRVWLERELIEARERAEQAALSKSRFLANMSHEIRTPMNGVLGFAELLMNSELAPEQRRKVGLIVESGKSMMCLLNDILDISKIEVGALVVSSETFSPREVLESCVSISTAQAEQKGLRLGLKIDRALPKTASGDPLRLRQVVLNLVGNAIKFTERGKVAIAVAMEGETMVISVSDTGIGISAERLEAIFLPFEQADNATSRRYGGTGLGLAISRELAGLMGGGLSAQSTPGAGSTFTLRLPLAQAKAPLAAPEPIEPRPAPQLIAGDARILLVDDHDMNRELASEMLASLGFAVEVAVDGLDAIAKVRANAGPGQFRLVLMDIQMPNCDGLTATRAIRAAGFEAESLPIVAMTANAYPEDIRAALAAGMQAHLAKPISLGSLRETLAAWTNQYHDGPRAAAGPAGESAVIVRSERLVRMWSESRAAALDHVDRFLGGEEGGEWRDALEREMHKISGTALRFGEAELGARAGALERALRGCAPLSDLRELARAVRSLDSRM